MLIVQRVGDVITIAPENEAEKKLMDSMEDNANNKKQRLSKQYSEVIATDYQKRQQLTLKEVCEDFLSFKIQTTAVKTMMKYKQCVEYLYIYFGEKHKLNNLAIKDASKFRTFLLGVPKNWKGKKELKGKDIKKLVEVKSKILEKFEKQSLATVDEIIKRVKSIFKYFSDNEYLPQNIFEPIEKLSKGAQTSWREFKIEEFKDLIQYLKKNDFIEEYNFCKFALMTGLRRGEILQLKKEHIDIKKGYIDTEGVKTEYAKRIIPIHKDLHLNILKQFQNKSNEQYLFYDSDTDLSSREEKVGLAINEIIKIVVGEEKKKGLNIHSFRKNFTQEIFLSDLFREIDYKTMVGHSTKSDVTDKHYIRGKRDYPKLKEKMNKVDFSEYFDGFWKDAEVNINLGAKNSTPILNF